MNNSDFQGWILSLLNKSLSNNRQYFYKISEQSDKIIVWLVGFSITSIALSISKNTELNSFINNLTNYILICGSLTVIFGVLYRIFLYLAQAFESMILMSFENYIEGYNNPPDVHFGRELSEKDTYDDIVDYIKIDFDIEIERVDTKLLDLKQVQVLRKSVIDYYLSLNNWSNQKLEREKKEVKDVLATYLGYSKKKLERIFNPQEPKIKLTTLYWFCFYAASSLFIMSCLAFTSGMIIILVKYIIKISS
jgi:hypothetical protein